MFLIHLLSIFSFPILCGITACDNLSSALAKVFLPLEIPTSSSKSSCTDSAISANVIKIPSIASLSLFSDLTNAAMAAFISSSIFVCELSSS